jgi:hypothetical protein
MGLEIIIDTVFGNTALRQLPPALGFADTFNRANGAFGLTEIGDKPWTAGAGWAITSNEAKFTGSGDANLYADMNTTDFTATLEITELTGQFPFGFNLGTVSSYFKFYRDSGGWIARDAANNIKAASVTVPLAVGTLVITRAGNSVTITNNGGAPFTFALGANVIPAGTILALRGSGGAAGTPLRINSITVTP